MVQTCHDKLPELVIREVKIRKESAKLIERKSRILEKGHGSLSMLY